MEKQNTSKLKLIASNRALTKCRFSLPLFSLRIDESEADKTERLDKWEKYLENEDAKKEIAEKNQQSDEAMKTSMQETSSAEPEAN